LREIAAFFDMVGMQFPAAWAARIVLRILALIIGAFQHSGGPGAVFFGQQIRIRGALWWRAEADTLGGSCG